MQENKMLDYIKSVLENMPTDWLKLTTHRLDIYNEEQAKTQFLDQFESLFNQSNSQEEVLSNLPTAYDYIRLGHPLSCILEWVISKLNDFNAENVISFSSKTTPILAVLRKNLIDNKNTQIYYSGHLPESFDVDVLRKVYGYQFNLKKVGKVGDVSNPKDAKNDSLIFVSQEDDITNLTIPEAVDFYLSFHSHIGSILIVNGSQNESYVSEIQHVRRRETVAMTPADSLAALKIITGELSSDHQIESVEKEKETVLASIKEITDTNSKPIVASSGLSIQYAIMMGLIHDARENHKGKAIKFVVPPNCYGGTNDQARRVAACMDDVQVVDLPVDGDSDMVKSLNTVLTKIAKQDAIPFIIAEIPTNPRVEVPDLDKLRDVLTESRKTESGTQAIDPVFILDQTFCPNVHFIGDEDVLSEVRIISYSSGSKFPSGGLCNAGYCVANRKANSQMQKIELHLNLCDNEATDLQYEILAKQMPSMIQRIQNAYANTREFVNFVTEVLPEAKINFVSEELAKQGFTPSVFSLDLPTKGNTDQEREAYKRKLNHKLIQLMITEIPQESKYCVSYGQLRGCYWTIPATSTQGTTKEGDKDYIARVALSANMDMELHKKIFLEFVKSI